MLWFRAISFAIAIEGCVMVREVTEISVEGETVLS
jgi:hypothetical protein